MDGVLSAISAESCAKGLRGLSLRSGCVSGSDQLSPAGDGISGHKLHTSNNIASDELGQVREERLVAVLSVELAGGLLTEL